MITNDHIESYLDRLGAAYDRVDEGFWVVNDDDGKIVVRHDDPIIVFRIKLMDVPEGSNREALFTTLLELNASEMVTAAYGLEENAIVAVASLQSENLDYNEFHGAVDSLTIAMTEHIEKIRGAAN